MIIDAHAHLLAPEPFYAYKARLQAAGCYSERETYSEHFITEESIAIRSAIYEGNARAVFSRLKI